MKLKKTKPKLKKGGSFYRNCGAASGSVRANDEVLTLETSALKNLHNGQLTLSTQLDQFTLMKPNYLVNPVYLYTRF